MDDATANLRAALDELHAMPSGSGRLRHARQRIGTLLATGRTMDEIAVDTQASINDLFAVLGGSAHRADAGPDWYTT